METPAPPTFPPARRRGAAVVVAAVVALALGLLAAAGPASGQVGGPLGPGSTTTEDDSATTTEAAPTTEATSTTREATSPSTTAAPASTEPVATGDAALAGTDDSGVGRTAAAIGAIVLGLLALGVGLLIGLALGRGRTPPSPGPAHGVPGGPVPGPAPAASAPPSAAPASPVPAAGGPLIGPAPDRDTDRLRTQRDGLVAGLIDLREQLPSEVLRDEVGRTLASAGITELHPDGETFDPAVHRAVAQRPATDAALHNTVAATERPGYLDGSRVLRQPEVVVHRVDGQP